MAHKAVVDIDAVELVADGLVEQGGHDGGVDPAGKAKQHMVVADLLTYLVDGMFDKSGHFPITGTSANFKGEVPKHFLALRGMNDFGVELDAKDVSI